MRLVQVLNHLFAKQKEPRVQFNSFDEAYASHQAWLASNGKEGHCLHVAPNGQGNLDASLMRNVDLSGLTLIRAYFQDYASNGQQCIGTNFSGATFYDTALIQANLKDANFFGAKAFGDSCVSGENTETIIWPIAGESKRFHLNKTPFVLYPHH